MPKLLRILANLTWLAGDLASWCCTRCYRLAGRLNGYAYEATKQGSALTSAKREGQGGC